MNPEKPSCFGLAGLPVVPSLGLVWPGPALPWPGPATTAAARPPKAAGCCCWQGRQDRPRPDQAKAGHNRQASQAKAGVYKPNSGEPKLTTGRVFELVNIN